MKTSCKARKWGNSLGITLPKEIVEQQHIKPNEELIITIEKKRPKLFGIMKGFDSSDFLKWRNEERRKEHEDDEKLWKMVSEK
ncbi:MAG: AbrB/MazE/SpoVT family DNA-binding domain-containing protein [Nanoarchaeota archaeon]